MNTAQSRNSAHLWNFPAALLSLGLLAACGIPAQQGASSAEARRMLDTRERAMQMWKARCERSGVFVHKRVEGVEGIYLINVRTRSNFGESTRDQFSLDDPYGHDSTGERYIINFLRGAHHHPVRKPTPFPDAPRNGYHFVEAIDPKDGKLYRFTGRIDEPWQKDKSYRKGYTQFVADRAPIEKPTARYGVNFTDISTKEERQYWIAGSSLTVIDLVTGEVLAERVGYMVDWAQGSRAGQRSPWLFAADNACPDFLRGEPRKGPASVYQPGQTLDFVEQVLKPK